MSNFINKILDNSRAAENTLREYGGITTHGYGVKYSITKIKIDHPCITTMDMSTDIGIFLYIECLFPKTYGHRVKVENGVIYTNKKGMIIGRSASVIKDIEFNAGKKIKILDYDETEEELMSLLQDRYAQQSKTRVLIKGYEKGYTKALTELAKNHSTKVHSGDQYNYEAIEGWLIGYILARLGYESDSKITTVTDFNNYINDYKELKNFYNYLGL